MHFVEVESALPPDEDPVLARGWGSKRQHYVYEIARYQVKTACRQWLAHDGCVLWFEPIEWAVLPQPTR